MKKCAIVISLLIAFMGVKAYMAPIVYTANAENTDSVSIDTKYTNYTGLRSVEKIDPIPPVLHRIAKCESGNNQNVVHINRRDVGLYGINLDAWGAKAKELGFNLYTAEGNEQMALYIYHQRGTAPWLYSSKCWNK